MFHRRLLLLALLVIVGFALPSLQLARLTLLKGEDLRRRAEARLEVRSYLPTQRGRILDRKGRVLAADRPSYNVEVEYSVISGQWAFTEAATIARRAVGVEAWRAMSPLERELRVQQQLPLTQQTLASGWRHVAKLCDVPLEQIEERTSAIIRGIQQTEAIRRESERAKLEAVRREEALARGEELAQEIEVHTADVRGDVRERSMRHVVIRGISDDAAFRLLTAMARAESEQTGPILPGLKVEDASAREYPGDRDEVTLQRDHFPGPLRSPQPLTLEIRGLATHIVGWMRSTVYQEDLELRRDDSIGRPAQPAVDRPAMVPVPRQPGEDLDSPQRHRPDLGFYMEGDSVGASGVERSAEPSLRGSRGLALLHIDTATSENTPQVPGRDVSLTIDMRLQARIQALLDPRAGLATVQAWHGNKAIVPAPGSPGVPSPSGNGWTIPPGFKTIEIGTSLGGAVVVIDVDSGDILALVSSPTMTHEQIVGMDPDSLKRLIADPVGSPMRNRAIADAYPPGSIVKPLMYAAAVSSGVIDPLARIGCQGLLYPEKPEHFRCWVFKQFNSSHSEQLGGDLNASDALMVSCNIFFYNLGRSLGPERISEWYGKFGVGDDSSVVRPRLGIGAQYPGAVGRDDTTRSMSIDEATFMGIGQGPVAWTPLHAADAYCTLARGGVRIVPRLRTDQRQEVIDLRMDKRAFPMILDGLKRATTDERGSAHHITLVEGEHARREPTFNARGITVWGKSGTADAPPAFGARPENNAKTTTRPMLRDGDHSWCVALAGPAADPAKGEVERPRYAIATVVEFGGSGGRVAAPVVNQVIHALIAEGYLPAVTEASRTDADPDAAAKSGGPGQ